MDRGDHDEVLTKTCLPTQPYLDMTIQEVQKQYSPSMWTGRDLTDDQIVPAHIATLLQESEKACNVAPFSIGVSYGDTEKQKMDILMPDSLPTDCPIFMFIHGGYWQILGRELSSFMALPIYEAGGAVITIGYDLSPHVSLSEIVRQVKEAVKYVLHLAKHRGSRGVYMGGHSAGGNLAAMMLSVDWMTEAPGTSDLIKGAALLSGVFDVRPLVLTEENKTLRLNEDTAWECSPFKHVHKVHKNCRNVRVLVAYGADESPEFIRQSQEYHQALEEMDISSTCLSVAGEDHFTLAERLCQPRYTLTEKLLDWMGLS